MQGVGGQVGGGIDDAGDHVEGKVGWAGANGLQDGGFRTGGWHYGHGDGDGDGY